jgi:hypothetical protein
MRSALPPEGGKMTRKLFISILGVPFREQHPEYPL